MRVPEVAEAHGPQTQGIERPVIEGPYREGLN